MEIMVAQESVIMQASHPLLTAPIIAGLIPARNPLNDMVIWNHVASDKVMYMPSRIAMPERDHQVIYEYDDKRWMRIEPRIRAEALTSDETLMDVQGVFLRGECTEAEFLRAGRDWMDRNIALRRKNNKDARTAVKVEVEPPPVKVTPQIDRTPAIANLVNGTIERRDHVRQAHLDADVARELNDAATLKSLLRDWLNIDCDPKSSVVKVGVWTYRLTGRLGLGQKGLLGYGITIERDAPHRGYGKTVRSGYILDRASAEKWMEWVREKYAEEIDAIHVGTGKAQYFGKNTATARKVNKPYKTLDEMNAERDAIFQQGAARLNNIKQRYAGV
jgi:hypothetical protein